MRPQTAYGNLGQYQQNKKFELECLDEDDEEEDLISEQKVEELQQKCEVTYLFQIEK